jgi:MscS family membrane protein
VRQIIENDDRFAHDFYLVSFHAMAESSLSIFVYAFTNTTNWAEYMGIRQQFLLAVLRALRELDIGLAFPTRTVHLEGALPPGAPRAMLRQAPR